MKERRLPIMPTLAAVYRDWRRLLFPLRTILISALLIVLAISAVAELVPHRLWDGELSGAALGLAEDAVRAFLLTPIVIAIHRFVGGGEVTPGYGLDVSEPAFWHRQSSRRTRSCSLPHISNTPRTKVWNSMEQKA